METLLVHRDIAPDFLPEMARRLGAAGVELRGDAAARALVPGMTEATEEDWSEEYLDLILAVRVVDSLEAAIDHINTYGSQHSDVIVSTDPAATRPSWPASTPPPSTSMPPPASPTAGEFGMGAEIGISTDKLHARGPMGLEELTTYKYVIRGEGQIRE